MNTGLPVVAGAVSTAIFALGALPMLLKAVRTKNLASYSLGNIMLTNNANVIHSVYVFHLPAGPIWILHSFYLSSTGLMLFWYLRYSSLGRQGPARGPRPCTTAITELDMSDDCTRDSVHRSVPSVASAEGSTSRQRMTAVVDRSMSDSSVDQPDGSERWSSTRGPVSARRPRASSSSQPSSSDITSHRRLRPDIGCPTKPGPDGPPSWPRRQLKAPIPH